ncbi:MAG: ATP-binding protein [Desulfovibrionaceae bacterium]|nr:ATP-binding protein [Desulfovibrionaceae bacterium]
MEGQTGAKNGANAAAAAGTQGADEQELSLSYARTVSWLSLLVVLLVSLGLSVIIANQTRRTLMERQEGLALLLAHNLNNQIFQRFAVPTIREYGHISLRNEKQQELMDSVVRSVIVGLPVQGVRVYDPTSRGVTYSTDYSEFGRMDMHPVGMEDCLQGRAAKPVLESSLKLWEIPFHWPLQPGTVRMTALFPLRGDSFLLRLVVKEFLAKERDLSLPPNFTMVDSPLMGVLEVTQDITEDYVKVLQMQAAIVVMCLLSSVIMFAFLRIILHRAERVLKYRMQKNMQLEKQLQSTERLVSMGRVVASIAHEIRNPLGIIRSTAELLQKRAASSSDRGTQRLLEAMHDETLRLSQTVNDFLDYARPRQPRQDPVELELVFNQITAFAEGDFNRAGITLDQTFDGKLWVLGDKDLLYRAFYNILVNGRQAMDGSGAITIHGFVRDNMAIVDVTDTGPGFDQDLIDKLFEPFFTTKDAGTGLGLPIVRSIIESHGGTVSLSNREEGGARVEVSLPLAPMDARPAEPAGQN